MNETGTIGWFDLTVDDAGGLRDFYEAVVGWKSSAADMGDYSDFTMNAPDTGEPIAGVCHARGPNAGMPAQWLAYVNVPDLDASMGRATELGGAVVVGPRDMGSHGRMAVVRDPAGAVMALVEPPA